MLVLIGAAVCLVLASPEGGRAWPGFGWLRAMGKASYEIYLTHMFVVFSLVGVARMSGTDKAYGWIWYVPAVLLSWALGWMLARGILGAGESLAPLAFQGAPGRNRRDGLKRAAGAKWLPRVSDQ